MRAWSRSMRAARCSIRRPTTSTSLGKESSSGASRATERLDKPGYQYRLEPSSPPGGSAGPRSCSAATPCDATASTTADRAAHAVSPSAHDAGRWLRGDQRRGRPLQAHPYLVTAAPCRDAGGAARVVVLHEPFRACGARGLAGAGRSRGHGGARSLRLSPPDPAHPLSPGSARWDQFGAAPRSVQGDSRAPAAGPLPAPRDPGGRHRPTPHRAPWSRSSRLARDP